MIIHPHLTTLLQCIAYEEAEERRRYAVSDKQTIKQLKNDGLALHPITITHKGFGYADYPEFSFRLPYPTDNVQLRDGAAIECFYASEAPVKGVLLNLDNGKGECRLFAPDYPDWLEEKSVGIKLVPDLHTTTILKTAIQNIATQPALSALFTVIHPLQLQLQRDVKATAFNKIQYYNPVLNLSQQQAVAAVLLQPTITIIHGPPGTGKTTTLIEAIQQLIKTDCKILVAAPSNTAVDNIAKGLIACNVNILRVGNTAKISAVILPHTIEGKLNNPKQLKEIKALKQRAEQFRKMALKYKRNFGKAEREQRSLLFKEVKNVRAEIKKLQAYNETKLVEEASVILGTPIALYDAHLSKHTFTTLIIDEAGQCLQPLAWCIMGMATSIVLAGDHLQLPPTVLSSKAAQLGYSQSILEVAMATIPNAYFLNVQHRMRQSIAQFSSNYFYNSALTTPPQLSNIGQHVIFIDTAGSGYNETAGDNGSSLQNTGEVQLILKAINTYQLSHNTTVVITPYAGQVQAAKAMLPADLRVSTIDSFQGQEAQTIILSLVRSNYTCEIGFLKDYRRMNVALTRAKELLIVIGDSATLGANPFYNSFITYVEANGTILYGFCDYV